MSTSPSPIHSSPDSYGDIINEIDTVLDPRDSEPRRPTLSPSLLVASLETETPDNANATKNASQMDSVNSLHPQHASRGVIHAPDASTSSPLPKLTRSPREAIVAVALQPANNTNDQQKKTILVSIAQGELFADAARRAAWEHDEVPESLVEEITGQLARAVVSQGKRKREEDTRREGQEKETGTGSEIQRQIQVQDLVDAYARNYSEFNVVLRQVCFSLQVDFLSQLFLFLLPTNVFQRCLSLLRSSLRAHRSPKPTTPSSTPRSPTSSTPSSSSNANSLDPSKKSFSPATLPFLISLNGTNPTWSRFL